MNPLDWFRRYIERDPVPDLPTPITAYRSWKFETDPLTLCSVYRDVDWPALHPLQAVCLNVARCMGWGLPVPASGPCPITPAIPIRNSHQDGWGCGIYGYESFATMEADNAYQSWPGRPGYTGDIVIGIVQMWGDVWQHAKGWRSQFAQVAALYRPGPDCLDELAALYGVPIFDLPTKEIVHG